ncbi:MAG: hypothetical protein ACREJX_06335, partial [Polyangiaceae bacterium]
MERTETAPECRKFGPKMRGVLGCELPMRSAAFFSVAITLITSSVVASTSAAPKMVTAHVVANAAALRFGK